MIYWRSQYPGAQPWNAINPNIWEPGLMKFLLFLHDNWLKLFKKKNQLSGFLLLLLSVLSENKYPDVASGLSICLFGVKNKNKQNLNVFPLCVRVFPLTIYSQIRWNTINDDLKIIHGEKKRNLVSWLASVKIHSLLQWSIFIFLVYVINQLTI